MEAGGYLAGTANLSLPYQGWCTLSIHIVGVVDTLGLKSHFYTAFDLLLYSFTFWRHSANCLNKNFGHLLNIT